MFACLHVARLQASKCVLGQDVVFGGGNALGMSPEVHWGACFTPQADVYALGVVIRKLVSPYLSAASLRDAGHHPLAFVLETACDEKPVRRLSARDIVAVLESVEGTAHLNRYALLARAVAPEEAWPFLMANAAADTQHHLQALWLMAACGGPAPEGALDLVRTILEQHPWEPAIQEAGLQAMVHVMHHAVVNEAQAVHCALLAKRALRLHQPCMGIVSAAAALITRMESLRARVVDVCLEALRAMKK